MHECLALAKAGVPWLEIMDMDATMRRGMCIAAGIVEGNEFDWNARRWKDQANA